jgi:ribosomal-protein-alanine N-acetyltransferase
VASLQTLRVELLSSDVVATMQCIAIDADAFPYPSAQFGVRARSSRIWVARDEGEARVVGFLAGRVGGRSMHVHGLAVDRAARRRGVARALLRKAVEDGSAEGLCWLILYVSLGNRAALALYESERFAIVRRVRGFYPRGAFGGERDAYEMARRL